jgi:hypothetical protein
VGDGVPPIEAVEQVTLPPIRPAAGWYVLGAAVIVAGLVGGFLLLTAGAFGYLRQIDDLARVGVPGSGAVDLPGGEVAIYHEPSGGAAFGPDALGLSVVSADGDELALQPSQGDDYAVDDRRGVEVARVVVERPGTYDVTTAAGTGELALGAAPGRHLTAFGAGALALAGVALVVGTVQLVVVRRRRRRALAERDALQRGAKVARLA